MKTDDPFLFVQIKPDAGDSEPVLRAVILGAWFSDAISLIGSWVHEHASIKHQRYNVTCSVHGWQDSGIGETVAHVTCKRSYVLLKDDMFEGETMPWFNPWPIMENMYGDLHIPGTVTDERGGTLMLDIVDRDLAMLFRLRWQDWFVETKHVQPGEELTDWE